MMDLIKLCIYIMVVSVMMSHVSMQQETTVSTTAAKSKSTVKTTVAPSALNTTSPNTTTAPTTAVNKENTTAAPTTAVNKENTTAAPTTAVNKENTTAAPTTAVNKENTTAAPTTAVNKENTTAAPTTAVNKENTTAAPTTAVTKENTTAAPTTAVTKENTTAAPTTAVTKENTTAAPTTAVNKENTTAAPTTAVNKENTTAAPTTAVNKENTTAAPITTTDPNKTSNKVTTTLPKTEAPTTKTEVPTTKTEVPTTKTEAPTTKTEAPTTKTEVPTTKTVAPTTKTEVPTTKTVAPTTKTEAPTTKTEAPTTKTEAPTTKTVAPTTKTETPTSEPKTSKTVPNSSGATPTTTQAHEGSRLIYINEIVVDKNGTFQKIELHLSNQFVVNHYAMVIVDGETNKYMAVVNLTGIVQQNGLLLINFNNTQSSPIVKDKGTGIAIYDTTQITMSEAWSGEVSGLMDALVIGKDYTLISQYLTQRLTPGVNPFVLDPNIYGQSRTISRCSSDCMRSTDMYALTNPSFGYDNDDKCNERLSKFKTMSIKISGMDCKLLEDLDKPETSDELSVRAVLRNVAKEVNKQCRCGLTLMHIIRSYTTVKCCDGASLDMRFVASSEQHLKELSDSYELFLRNTKSIVIDKKQYTLDSKCEGHCCQDHTVGPTGKSSDDKAKDIKVTVAVIVSCLVVFSIVVVIVILYMKKKNRAVYQFRMSRLDEEDDLYHDGPDHEDFVGGQEATFDVKYR